MPGWRAGSAHDRDAWWHGARAGRTERWRRRRQVLLATNGYTTTWMPDLDSMAGPGQVLLYRSRWGPLPRAPSTWTRDTTTSGTGTAASCWEGVATWTRPKTTLEEGTLSSNRALETLLREAIPSRTGSSPSSAAGSGVMGIREGKEPLVERLGNRIVTAVRLSGMACAIGPRVARRAVELLG